MSASLRVDDERLKPYDGSLGNDLRAMRRRQWRSILELVLTVVAALAAGAVCGWILVRR